MSLKMPLRVQNTAIQQLCLIDADNSINVLWRGLNCDLIRLNYSVVM